MNSRSISRAIQILAASALLLTAAQAADIEPPKVKLVDKFGVNMANGQVTHSMQIVSIGGAMGLSDSISVYANDFNFIGNRGFAEKYFAQARDVQLDNSAVPIMSPRNIMRVYGPSGSADFQYLENGVKRDNGDFTANYTYAAIGDQRNILEVVGNNLEWTTADGTILRFDRGSVTPKKAMTGGFLTSIEYPNGFMITVTSAGMGVNTNTGFQLKSVYASDSTSCYVAPANLRSSDESGWTLQNPKRIIGINATIDRCPATNTSCTALTKKWPTAEFNWPHCMPDVMFHQNNNQVDVTNAQGIKTAYKFTRYDLALDEYGNVVGGYTPNTQFSARLSSVGAPNNSATDLVRYTYKNVFVLGGDPPAESGGLQTGGGVDYRLTNAGVAVSASHGAVGSTYQFNRPYQNGPDMENVGGPNGGVSYVRVLGMINGAVGAIDYADTQDGRIFFEHAPRNFPTSFDRHSAPRESYGYDGRGNLTSISYIGTAETVGVIAEYPASCTQTTRKVCNQATRIRDRKGNWTDFTYYPENGQLKSIELPPDNHGTRAKTRFEYQQLGASYYGPDGLWIDGNSPSAKKVWLKTSERTCINSQTVGDACAGGDEVVTSYEYNHPNLLLTGMKVTSPTGVRRTCYSYDIYGNQIGVTTPNANIAQCPGSAP